MNEKERKGREFIMIEIHNFNIKSSIVSRYFYHYRHFVEGELSLPLLIM